MNSNEKINKYSRMKELWRYTYFISLGVFLLVLTFLIFGGWDYVSINIMWIPFGFSICSLIMLLIYHYSYIGLINKSNVTSNREHFRKDTIKYNQQDSENESSYINKFNQSDFQQQLQESSKPSQQVEEENWLKEKDYIIKQAGIDYASIKQQILNKAKLGQYLDMNRYKAISINYYCSYLMQCIHKECYFNPTGKMGTSSYRTNKKVSYSINKRKQYDLYLSIIKEYASKDNIIITVLFVERDPLVYQKENKINLPYTYAHEWRTSTHEIKAYLKCSIQY